MTSSLYSDGRWFLAAGIARGIGRTWIARADGLSHVDPGEPLYMSAPTLAAAKRWCRETLGVPLHWDEAKEGVVYHGYCLDKYVEQVPRWDSETETYS